LEDNPQLENNPEKEKIELKLRAKHDPIITSARCPVIKCNKKTTHLLYLMVGYELSIKSLYGALCEEHATKKREFFMDKVGRECIIEKIEDINSRTLLEAQEKNVRDNSEKPQN
jgi:hypothetical protein